jgi:hypothetical protein
LFGSTGSYEFNGLPTWEIEELGIMRVPDKPEPMPVCFLYNGLFCFRAKQAGVQMEIRGQVTRLGVEVFSILDAHESRKEGVEGLRAITNNALVSAVVLRQALGESTTDIWVTGEPDGRRFKAMDDAVAYGEHRAQETGFPRYVIPSPERSWGTEIAPVPSFRS